MLNKQVMIPDDFYDYIEAIESGRIEETQALLPLHIRDEIFLGNVTHVDVLLTLLSTTHDMTKVKLDVTEIGGVCFEKAVPPTTDKLTDLGRLDDE